MIHRAFSFWSNIFKRTEIIEIRFLLIIHMIWIISINHHIVDFTSNLHARVDFAKNLQGEYIGKLCAERFFKLYAHFNVYIRIWWSNFDRVNVFATDDWCPTATHGELVYT